jgi:two-component system cell cycle response regulator DivK
MPTVIESAKRTGAPAPLVLIVEDNEDNRMVAATMLRHVGYRVAESVTGYDGLAQAQSLQPAVIIMDVGLPDVDGWTITRTLKTNDDTRHIPVIAYTAHVQPEDWQMAYKVGCDGYLTKPMEPIRLVHEVARVLAAPARAAVV